MGLVHCRMARLIDDVTGAVKGGKPFARCGVNLLKIESRPIHGRPWEYQFFIDVETEKEDQAQLKVALMEVEKATSHLHVLGLYSAAPKMNSSAVEK